MEANSKRHIKDGWEYEQYFPLEERNTTLIKKGSNLEDTVRFLPKAIRQSLDQTRQFAPTLRGKNLYETCENIWNWVYEYINYQKDEPNKEQIRSPRRSFWDRKRGVDCDDYTVLISSLLSNLKIKHVLRVSKYTEENGYQHIYPVVPNPDGGYITIDCVVDKFNYEVPFIQKKDTKMDLEYLNGIGHLGATPSKGIDASDLLDGYEDMEGLGKGGKLKAKIKNSKVFKVAKKALNVVNKVNPAAALLRVGILAAMKINMFKIASSLRYGYLTNEQAQAKNLDMGKFQRLQNVKQQIEKIFYGAGGNLDNLKKSILTGKGNSNKEVPLSGLGAVDYRNYTEDDDLSTILGVNTYRSEMNGVEGLGSLGVVATSAALAAATTALTAIAGLIKSIGSLKKGGQPTDSGGSESEGEAMPEETTASDSSNEDSSSEPTPTPFLQQAKAAAMKFAVPKIAPIFNRAGGANNRVSSSNTSSDSASSSNDSSSDAEIPAATEVTENEEQTQDNPSSRARVAAPATTATTNETKPSLMNKVKTWVQANKMAAAGIALGTAGVIGFLVYRSKKKTKKTSPLSGVRKSKKSKATSKNSLKIKRLR